MIVEESKQIVTTPEPEPSAKNPVWGFWATVGLGIWVMFVFFFVQLVALGIFIGVKYFANPASISIEYIKSLATNGLVLAIATVASAIVCTGLIIFIVKLRSGASIKAYLTLKPIKIRTALILLGITLGFLILSVVVAAFFEKSGGNGFVPQAYQTSGSQVLFWLALVIFAPVFEEIFFRGLLFEGFSRSRIGAVGAVFFTALFWAILHIQYDFIGMGTVFVLGIVLGVVRYKTKSLYATLIMHSFWNLLGLIAMALALGF